MIVVIAVVAGTLYSADAANPIDRNAYGVHPFYLDTRYFSESKNGTMAYVADAADVDAEYVSYSHGVFYRNAHGHEIVTKPENVTWRTIGGSVDLSFIAGPTQADVTRSYSKSVVGLPAMHPYWSFGFHQCRWGYKSWEELAQVVADFKKFGIPLEVIWGELARSSYIPHTDVCKNMY